MRYNTNQHDWGGEQRGGGGIAFSILLRKEGVFGVGDGSSSGDARRVKSYAAASGINLNKNTNDNNKVPIKPPNHQAASGRSIRWLSHVVSVLREEMIGCDCE